jgi:hypothetical protein
MRKFICIMLVAASPALAQVDDETGSAIGGDNGGFQFGTTTGRDGQTKNWQEFGSGNTRFYTDSSGTNCTIIRSGSYSNVSCY